MKYPHTSARFARTTAALSAAAVLGLAPILGAGLADAHVVARTAGFGPSGYGVITFMVPNESETAPTTELKVAFPGVKHLSPEGKAGWAAHVTKNAEGGVTEIRWTANPGTPGVPVGEFADFSVAGGPFTGEVKLPATQIYADGETVAWDQAPGPDGAEPEKPSPVINAAESSASGTDRTARWLGGLGLLAGVLGLGFGVAGRTRKVTPSDA
ncbi:MAG: DUF1775 domain-containing protein [Gordonia sp. (in: high G+C Gram-positive bacteria)]|uniref:DUF1775 domain-containing protein n=1 Tax=Gordonia sp. (in: high G+C Gram-positive bacteria) TaxID=84139 RepID=UPI0039E601C8